MPSSRFDYFSILLRIFHHVTVIERFILFLWIRFSFSLTLSLCVRVWNCVYLYRIVSNWRRQHSTKPILFLFFIWTIDQYFIIAMIIHLTFGRGVISVWINEENLENIVSFFSWMVIRNSKIAYHWINHAFRVDSGHIFASIERLLLMTMTKVK